MKIFHSGYLIAASLFGILLIGKYTLLAQNSKKQNTKADNTLLVFEKKQCYGYCPVYKAAFQKDGTVNVTYRQPGKDEKQAAFKLSAKEVCSLWERGEKLGFFTMKDRYDTKKMDFPVREVTLYKQNKPKKVLYTEGGGEAFDSYLADVATIVESKLNVNFGPPENE